MGKGILIADLGISEFHTTLEQYLNYLQAMEEQEPTRTGYLAVPADTYKLSKASVEMLPIIMCSRLVKRFTEDSVSKGHVPDS